MKEEQEENVLSESNTEQKDNPIKNEEIQNKVKTEMSQLIYYDFSLK
jgi:hypothetical protein